LNSARLRCTSCMSLCQHVPPSSSRVRYCTIKLQGGKMLNWSFMAHGRRPKRKDLLFSQKQHLGSSAHWHPALARLQQQYLAAWLHALDSAEMDKHVARQYRAWASSLSILMLSCHHLITIFWSLTDYYSVCLQIHVSSVSMKNFKNILYYISKKI